LQEGSSLPNIPDGLEETGGVTKEIAATLLKSLHRAQRKFLLNK